MISFKNVCQINFNSFQNLIPLWLAIKKFRPVFYSLLYISPKVTNINIVWVRVFFYDVNKRPLIRKKQSTFIYVT